MFKNITLEISLKPFKQTTDEYILGVCGSVFEQWRPLIKGRQIISIMMWSADGSELLEYAGRLDEPFEWCKYVGNANKPELGDGMPTHTSPHERKQLYIENPPTMTYRILKKIVSAFKSEGKRMFPDSVIRVGTTFDIGGEFAVSDFKFNRHREICGNDGCQGVPFIDSCAVLDGDSRAYASYPNGIPDKTPIGTFLGSQANVFLRDMGFDYIWLSNGFGFSAQPWNTCGKIYDGKAFHPEKLSSVREKVFAFWKQFRSACPDYPIETRGTNYSVGIDYASDGVPLYDIYNGNFNITPPPNSPWAAINDDIGIEVVGQLTRNCVLPADDYMFRYYLHDIWWMNSPWYDRYDSSPYDIYIPMALSRIDENGSTQSPTLFNILSIDNSLGGMPDACANETIPHFLKAEKDAPDEAAPLVLVYPFREYTTAFDEATLSEMYFGDTYLKNAVNAGFPISSSVSTDNFVRHSFKLYEKSTLVVPARLNNPECEKKLCEFAESGGKIIAYGSRDELDKVKFTELLADTSGSPDELFEAWSRCGYSVKLQNLGRGCPSMTIHRNNNALIFSVYGRDMTAESRLRFPLGSPILNGHDVKIEDGCAVYRFARSVHSECRVFVKQDSGVVSAREEAPVNSKYRRRIRISGLENAEVALFGEEYCKDMCIVTDTLLDPTPVELAGWQVVTDENGTYLLGKGISGRVSLCMPRDGK